MADNIQEVRVINAETGGEKGSKLQRFDLIPSRPLELLAEHYGRGAQKYTKEIPVEQAYAIIGKSCNCAKSAGKAESDGLPKPGGVGLATKKTYEKIIPNLLNAKEKIVDSGQQSTEKPKKNRADSPLENGGLQSSDLPKQTSNEYYKHKMAVPYAIKDRIVDGSILTMITKTEPLEDFCAEPVTKVLGTLETIQTELQQHEITCSARRQGLIITTHGVTLSGDRNWERGYSWGLSFAAMMRHAWAFWRGEDIDLETGSPHLVAVAWHAFALLEFGRTCPQLDDRSKT